MLGRLRLMGSDKEGGGGKEKESLTRIVNQTVWIRIEIN
jgi:hypothetical protein